MSYKTGEVSTTFDNQYVIHGLHCTLTEANQLLLKSDYSDVKAVGVLYEWATWGRMPEDISEESMQYGWWCIPENSEYKHKKKMTFIVTEESERIEEAIQKRYQRE